MSTADQPVADRPDYRRKRGELRIYLGAAPGVGKTFAMLGEAHRRVERGTDVVAAVVETHGRKKTADLLDRHRDRPAELHRIPGKQVPRARRRGGAEAGASGGAGRRARPHQHPGQQEPQTLAGRRGAARRRDHRDHDGQRPASGEPQRRRRPDHRYRAAGEGSRRDRPRGRPDRACRHHAGSVAAQARPRQRLCTRAGRRGAVQLLPPRQPDRTARARAAVAGRPGRRGPGEVPRREQDHRTPGRPASASSSPSPADRNRKRWCAEHLASRRSPAPN